MRATPRKPGGIHVTPHLPHGRSAGGNLLGGFPFTPGANRVFSYSTPVLADLDQDGYREIICGDHSISAGNGAVHVLRNDGSTFPGWPRFTNYWIYGLAAVGDIDGDESPDIAIGDQVLSGSPVDHVYAWDASGMPLPGFPIGPIWAINSQVLLADLDGDDQIELMVDDNTSGNQYLAFNHDGTPLDGWPLPVQGTTFFINPFVADVNQDGELDISGGGSLDNNVYIHLWDANVPVNPGKNVLTILQYGPHHDGVYQPVDPAGVTGTPGQSTRQHLHCRPSPCQGSTTIAFAGPPVFGTELRVLDLSGRLVRVLPIGAAGALWNGRDDQGRPVSAGAYWLVAHTDGQCARQRIVITR